MANTNMDNYIDSLEKGQEIEFDGVKHIFEGFAGEHIVCENGEIFSITEFHDDCEYGENRLYQKFIFDNVVDSFQEEGILNSKQEKDV